MAPTTLAGMTTQGMGAAGPGAGQVPPPVAPPQPTVVTAQSPPQPALPVAQVSDAPVPAQPDPQAAAPKEMPPPPSVAAPPPDETEKARNLVVQANVALQKGDLPQAKKLNDQARALHANLFWWEDNPTRVAANIARLEGQVLAVRNDSRTGAPANALVGQQAKEEAVALLRQGKAQMETGKIDDAVMTLLKVRTLNVTKWGLFDYTPDKFRDELDKARIKRDQEESVRVMAEARRLFQKGDLDNAMRAAYRTQKLHGPYPRYDLLSDRPSSLMTEIEKARQKQYKAFGTNTAVAQKDQKKDTQVTAVNSRTPLAQPTQPLAPVSPEVANKARAYLEDARFALQRNDLARARLLADYVRDMKVPANQLGNDSPEAIYRDLERVAHNPQTTPGTQNTSVTPSNAVNSAAPANQRPPVALQAPPSTPSRPASMIGGVTMPADSDVVAGAVRAAPAMGPPNRPCRAPAAWARA